MSFGSASRRPADGRYIGTDENVHLKIYRQNIDQTGDRETRDFNGDLDSTDLNEIATGIATFSALDLESHSRPP